MDFVDRHEKVYIYIYMRMFLKSAFAYDRIWSSWCDQYSWQDVKVQLLSNLFTKCQFCCCFGDPNAHCNSSTFCLSAGAAGEGSSGGPPPQGSGPAVSVERPLLSTTLQAEDGSQKNQSGLADLPDKETVPVLSVGRHHSAERSSFFSFFPKELVFLQQLSFLFFFSRNTGLSPTDKNDPVKKSKCGFCFKMLHWFYFIGTVSLGSVMVSGIWL